MFDMVLKIPAVFYTRHGSKDTCCILHMEENSESVFFSSTRNSWKIVMKPSKPLYVNSLVTWETGANGLVRLQWVQILRTLVMYMAKYSILSDEINETIVMAGSGIRDLQILVLMLCEFKRINYLLFPLKSSENHRFSDDFRGNRN